jgi:heme-degrading monooxygenase HmoA
MFIAMNRFRIARGREEDFIAVWKNRESHLDGAPGFREFHLLRGPTDEQCTLFASHSVWQSRAAFEDWTRSEAFRRAHAGAGAARDIYLGPPQFEGFDVVL